MDNLIEVKNLSVNIGDFSLNDISFTIPSNTIVALVGGNGSGKSVLIRTILNIIRQDHGEIIFFGKSITTKERDIKNQIGIVYDDGCFFEQLTILQMTEILSKGYKEWNQNKFEKYLDNFDLRVEMLIKDLSKGMKMKYALALSLSHNAKILILDEPTNGLDFVMRNEILKILKEEIRNSDRTIIFSSHIISDIEAIADKLLILQKGSLIFEGSIEDFMGTKSIGENQTVESALSLVIEGVD